MSEFSEVISAFPRWAKIMFGIIGVIAVLNWLTPERTIAPKAPEKISQFVKIKALNDVEYMRSEVGKIGLGDLNSWKCLDGDKECLAPHNNFVIGTPHPILNSKNNLQWFLGSNDRKYTDRVTLSLTVWDQHEKVNALNRMKYNTERLFEVLQWKNAQEYKALFARALKMKDKQEIKIESDSAIVGLFYGKSAKMELWVFSIDGREK